MRSLLCIWPVVSMLLACSEQVPIYQPPLPYNDDRPRTLPALSLTRNPFYPYTKPSGMHYFSTAQLAEITYTGFVKATQGNTTNHKAIIAYRDTQVMVTVGDTVADGLVVDMTTDYIILEEQEGTITTIALQTHY